ncbi:hypothetical protein [Undibacterium sp. WLHG33]|uniref:hypothetical protein n=1 Tax=Undibacterium sp. WLHG33 TaxID=3412482 RepID=UPI003C2B39BD
MNKDQERDRLARLMLLSQQKYGISIQGDWRHENFFRFLQISPSYRLAHLAATGGVQDLAACGHVPQDYADVVKIYEAFGDVWQTDFWNWWVKRAQYQFGLRCPPRVHRFATLQPGADADQQSLDDAQACLDQYFSADRLAEGKPGSLVIAIPLHADRATIMREVSKLMDEAEQSFGPDADTGQFKFLVNKIRRQTLDEARRVAWARAAAPKQPLYVIGNRVGIAAAYVTKEGVRAPKDNRRDLMVIVTSRQLKRALVFSENAARGRFPCSDEVDSIDFDFKELRSSIIVHRNWIKAELGRLKGL